jgi:geranylgeranylglycerol-phosphate geranylgeranyltransferase
VRTRLHDAQAALDRAVDEAHRHGLPRELRDLEPLPLLLALNQQCSAAENEGRAIAGPGLPASCAADGREQSDRMMVTKDPVDRVKESPAEGRTERRPGLLGKARAVSELARADLVLGAGIFVVAGEVLALGHLPPVATALLGFLTGLFVSGSANISNDYFDRDVDRVNRPDRPLPSGRVSVAELWALFAVFAAAGLASAALLGPAVLALAAIVWAVALLYNVRLKDAGLLGNLAVAFCVSMTVVIGGAAAGTVNGLVLTFGALAFLFDLGEEIASDAMDVEGDSLRSSRSIAAGRGRAHALKLSGVVFSLFVGLTFLPFLAGWLGPAYLLCAGVAGVVMSYLIAGLVRSKTIAAGRVLVRRLYLAWGAFVVAFVGVSLL